MKMPNWIQKFLHREPVNPFTPARSVRENFLEYLKGPSTECFQGLRQQVAASGRYAPYSNELDMMIAAIGAGEPQAAIGLFGQTFPSLLLSPSAHMALSKAHNSMGQENNAAFEKALARQLVRSILATGKGTKKKPYAVMRISDEWDVLSALRKQAGPQFLMMGDSRMLDLIKCSDGREVYFDITLFYGRGMKKEASAAAE